MKKLYAALLGLITLQASAQIKTQSFEGATTDTWGYTANPAQFSVGSDIWDTVTTLGGITTLPSNSTYFFGIQDLANGNGGTATGAFGALEFDTVQLNGTQAYISFDYEVDGFDNGDDIEYELWADGTSQGTVLLVDGSSNLDANGTEFVSIPSSTDSIRFEIRVSQNGGSDYGGIDNVQLLAGTAPAPAAIPTYSISSINNVDATTGVADSIGVTCWTKGVVLGVDLDGNNGISFTIWDTEGINVFNFNDVSNYVVNEGDSIMVRGTVGQFNGLTQIQPDSIQLVNSNNVIPTATVVTTLDETTESELVRFNNALITAVSGSNYELVSGMDTITMRVDSDTDVDDSLTFVVGDSLCYVIGIGGQFDGSSPYTEGYQVFPRYYTDVDTSCGGSVAAPTTPTYPIADINNVDANGEADSAGVMCWTKGVVLGVDMRGNGLQFTIWDNEGIGVFSGSNDYGYTVTEGDSIMIMGTVSQFNGLTQINPDTLYLVNSGNTIPTPTVVTTLGENTESELVRFENALVTGVSGSNYELVAGMDTITMRVDSDTDVDDSLTFSIGDSLCYVIGIGGQFDNSSPYFSGYQLFPRTFMDVDTSCGGITPPPAPAIPTYDIGLLRTVDANFEVDSLNVYCAVEGIVYGADLDGNNGISFHVKDETGAINIFNFNDVDNYVVTEGDEIRVVGEVIMYNGLAEIFADSITVLSTGNCIPFPRVVEQLDESTESDYIEIRNVTLAPGQFWPAPTFNENLDIVTENGDTLVMRIDKDTYIPDSILSAPSGTFNIVGIGGQFDGNAPYDEGYQIFPMFPYDFDTIADVAPAGFVINEVGPDNQSLVADNNGDFDNWLEVYNGGTETVDLVGMHVTGDLAAAQAGGSVARIPRCFNNAPVNLTVAAGEWALLWADDQPEQGPDHLDFDLSGTAVYPAIATPDLNTTADSIQVPSVATDHTYGRRTDGDTAWVTFEVGTPDASNNSGVILSVENVTSANAFAVFPNPVEGDELFFNQVADVTVYNALGGVVLQAAQVQSINVDAFDAGMYIIRTANADVVKVVVR